MNLEELQTTRDRERQTDKLQQLRETFYADAGEFIQQMRTERDRAAERTADPFDSPEVTRLTDEIKTAEQTVEAIYEKRVGKIVKAASFAAADLPAEAEGMTTEEQDLFETLVEEIKENRQKVLTVLAGDKPSAVVDSTAEPDAESGSEGVSAADLMGGGEDSTEEPASAPEGDSTDETDDPTPPAPPEPGETSDDDASPSVIEEPPAESDEMPIPPDVQADGSAGEDVESAGGDPSAESGAESEDEETLRNDGGHRSKTTPGDSTATETTQSATGPSAQSPEPPDASTNESTDDSAEAIEEPAVERRRVRIIEDIETFVGADDREYDLQNDDVVTLPEPNATLLVERNVAEQL